MMIFLKIIFEATVQAWQSLVSNKLRTFLSLLGISIGIFCIVAVKSAVDSLEAGILDGFKELGSNVIYVDKQPWNEDPGQNYWKYIRRPEISYSDYEAIAEKAKLAESASYTIFTGGKTIKYRSNNVQDAFIMGSTYEYKDILNLDIEKGRYFTNQEYSTGNNKCILGFKTAEALFKTIEPVGKEVKLFGQKFQVIGVLAAEGDNMFNFLDYDEVIWVPFTNVRRYVNVGEKARIGRLLNVKAKPGIDLDNLKGNLMSVLRAHRKLRPTQKENFALNEMSIFATLIEAVFGSLNIAGFIIGGFALLIGMFSVANIMFVSVKERTNIIGIKKALGAKNFVILSEFLIEAIFLCLIGGAVGILMVYLLAFAADRLVSFDVGLSISNLMYGVLWSIGVGMLAGFIPAYLAARLDPVEAMRG